MKGLKEIKKELLDKIKMEMNSKIDESKAEKGCAMLYFDLPEMKELHSIIESDDIYSIDGFGLEDEPHCTLLYGFVGDEVPNDVIEEISRHKLPIELVLTNPSLFENDNDVLKFDVKCEDLNKINKSLREKFSYENDFPDYKPHCTIAYLKKGTGKKYTDILKDKEIIVKPKKLVYSDKNNNYTEKLLK